MSIAKRKCRLFATLLFLGALISLSLAGWLHSSTQQFIESAINIKAEVIELVPDSSSEGQISHAPKVRFDGRLGQTHTETSSSFSYPSKYQVGDIIDILYDPESPEDFRTPDWFSMRGGSIIVGAIGIAELLAGILIWFIGPILYPRLQRFR